MRKIVASVGLVALGASGVEAASLGSSAEPAKPWNVSATLRGFYDDNINTAPDNSPNKKGSYGFEISPSILLNWSLEQTTINLGYVYSLKYNEEKPIGNVDHTDQNHNFNLGLNHSFSERYRLAVTDSFVIGQEPDQLRAGATFDTFQRISGNNIRNYGTINFDGDLTRQLGFQAGYANTFYDYADKTPTVGPPPGNPVESSHAGALNRLENAIHLDGRWMVQPQTTAILGYQYLQTDYTANEIIGGTVIDPALPIDEANTINTVKSDVRNSRSHYGYLGVDQVFGPNLTLNLRGGAQYIEFYNNPDAGTSVSPYGMFNLRYTYAVESYAELGFIYNRSATDQIGFDPNIVGRSKITTDAQVATVYGTLYQRLTSRIYGSLVAQFQNSMYQGGTLDNTSDRYYLVGLNLEYRFDRHFSANVGYNYDKLDSDIPGRAYDRNRVYAGITAAF
jgi:hypothetical protein